MPAPSGSELQVGWSFETADKAYKGPINEFFRAKSVSGAIAKRPLERNENLDPNRQTVRGVNVAAIIAPKFDLMPDVDSIVKLVTHDNKRNTITNLTGGAHRWDSQPWVKGDTAPASWIESFSLELDNGDGAPVLSHGHRMSERSLKITENKINMFSFTAPGCRDTYVNDVAPLAVNAAFTGRWVVFGHRIDPTSADALKIKCTLAGGSGVAKVKFTKGATAYGSTEYVVTYGVPIAVKLADDTRAGISKFEEFWVMKLDASGGGSVFTLNDEWTIANTRTAATASYSSRNVLHAAGVTVSIDGTSYPFHDVEVKWSNPRKAFMGTGSKDAQTQQTSGRRALSFSFNRDAEDLILLRKLISASSLAVIVDCFGDPITGSAYDEEWKITASNCQLSEVTRDITNEDTLPEKIEVEAFRSGATPIYPESITCTKSAI